MPEPLLTPDRPRRVGIVMLTALGGAVHVLPVINAIKRYNPAARVTWVLQPGPAALVRGHRAVDDIVLFDRARGLRGFLEVRRELRRRPFDVLLLLQPYLKAGIVAALARAPVKVGFDRARAQDLTWLATNRRIPPRPRQHVQEQFLEFLEFLGVPREPLEWDLGPWPEEREWQAQFFASVRRPAAALAIATSNPERDWIPERWAAVADTLVDRYGLSPILVGAAGEREQRIAAEIRAHARHRPIEALGSGVRKLVSIIDGSALTISLDTAPMHIATALGRPVISLMANADPLRTGPYRRFGDLVVDAFRDPGDPPDVVIWPRRKGRMRRIQVADVLEKVELWRQRYGMSSVGRAPGGSPDIVRPPASTRNGPNS
jgi:heptosyltransferase I